jgi:hypothetical protein
MKYDLIPLKTLLKERVNTYMSINNKSICYFETPYDIAFKFGKDIYNFIIEKKLSLLYKNEISVLDIFAGDGRLGNAIVKIASNHHRKIDTTYVEIDAEKLKLIKPCLNTYNLINKNAFEWNPQIKYDVIISNPPFEILNKKNSKLYGFAWNDVRNSAMNLYGLSILKCLDLCSDEGIVAVIAPFSWLRGVNSKKFHSEISKITSSVYISAFNHRGIFKKVIQDVGFQIFLKRGDNNSEKSKIYFKYNGFENQLIRESNLRKVVKSSFINVRVGPIVWNRKREFLRDSNEEAILLIYGGNIDHEEKLNLKNNKYSHKQFILRSEIAESDIIKNPAILIRRTLRGHPGAWKIDSCFIRNNLEYAVENHVIIVELLSDQLDYKNFYLSLIDRIKEYYYYSGTPSISTKVVNNLATQVACLKK